MDMNDDVGGLAGAMMSPAAFKIASWGQRVGPFVGPLKSAMGFDADDELGRPAHRRKLMPYWKGAGFTSLGDCIARGPVGNCRQTWRGYKWVSCGGSYCRQRADMDDEVGAWGLAGKLIMHELSGGRPAYDEDDNVGNVFGNGQ